MKQLILLFILLAVIGISCNNNQNNNSKENKEINAENENTAKPIKINVGYLAEFAGASAVAIAKEKGYFEEENLDVELFKFFNGHAAIISMVAGELDFAYIGHTAHNLIIDGKAQILIPNAISKGETIMTTKWANINSIEDLKGKTVATHFGTSGEAMLYIALTNANLSSKDINLINANITNLANLLINKKVDAISTWEPYTSEIFTAIPNDYKILTNITHYSNDIILTSSFISTSNYIQRHPETVEKFTRAILKAMDYRKDNLYETVALVSKLTDNDIESVKTEVDSAIWLTSSNLEEAYQSGDLFKWYEKQQKIFLYSELAKNDVPVTNYIEVEMLKDALDNL
ncbi:ABC transporter substrate-binding protein [uncultured Brachyspira sp.]|uniref:ABC transporter substrate-binding protein n=1 Tax=uncultured Brachyspira sp. TaxID=221953 RepID=UPI00260EC824|nr:ABC transporter substrate-binding protein [uncultured Brachyspira sp.]